MAPSGDAGFAGITKRCNASKSPAVSISIASGTYGAVADSA